MHSFKADFETDILVVGYGGAGAVAAIAAYDAGAKVTVIEKRSLGGGATRVASGGIFIAKGMEFADYLDKIFLHRTPKDILDVYVKHDIELEKYCEAIGVPIARWGGNSQEVSVSYPPLGRPSWPAVSGGDMIRVHAADPDEKPVDPEVWKNMTNNERVWEIGRTYGIHLWNHLKARTEERDIDIHYNVRARKLNRNENGEVIGVTADKDGSIVTYKAKKAVILCTGGFCSNKEMLETYLSVPFEYLATNDFAHGDGQIMCQKIGAKMWHMNAVVGQIAFKAPEFDMAFQARAVSEEFIWVDKFGRRYADETTVKLHNAWRKVAEFDPETNMEDGREWPRVPVYMIFDETTRKKAPISRDWRPDGDYKWSLDNMAEIERGWITKADTIEELAKKVGMEPSVLALTVARFNEYCRTGVDEEFGRDAKTMKPISSGPFYAMPWVPCMISTAGGPAHDKDSRVIDYDGKPIPRLYAAGELSTVVGWLYEAGLGHSECIVFGKVAGENAAREASTD